MVRFEREGGGVDVLVLSEIKFQPLVLIIVVPLVEQGGVYSIYYKVLYSLPEGGLGV